MQRWLRSFGNNWNIIRVSLSNIVSFLWPKCPWIKWVVTQTAIQQRYINSYKNILINNQNASSVRPSDPDRSFYNQRQREWQQKGKLFSPGKKKRAKERRVKEVAVLSTVAVHPEQRIGAVCSAAVAVVDWLRWVQDSRNAFRSSHRQPHPARRLD